MLLPLLFLGGGKLSVDHLLVTLTGRSTSLDQGSEDVLAFAIATLILGLVAVYLILSWGIVLLLLSAALFVYARVRQVPVPAA